MWTLASNPGINFNERTGLPYNLKFTTAHLLPRVFGAKSRGGGISYYVDSEFVEFEVRFGVLRHTNNLLDDGAKLRTAKLNSRLQTKRGMCAHEAGKGGKVSRTSTTTLRKNKCFFWGGGYESQDSSEPILCTRTMLRLPSLSSSKNLAMNL